MEAEQANKRKPSKVNLAALNEGLMLGLVRQHGLNILYIAMTSEGLPEATRQHLTTADGELKRIAHTTRQTLGFYRESSAPTSFQVSSLFDSVIDLLQAKTLSKRALIENQCDGGLQLTALKEELRQVLSKSFSDQPRRYP